MTSSSTTSARPGAAPPPTAADDLDEQYDAALTRLLDYGPTYDGGLSNHAPMALDALAELGAHALYDFYTERVSRRLEPAVNEATVSGDWAVATRAILPTLIPNGGSQAGHGLLRVGHALRALERSDTDTRRRELAAAFRYWSAGRPLPGPGRFTGEVALEDALADLPRLPEAPEGFLVGPIVNGLRMPEVADALAAVEPAIDIRARFDQLALVAAEMMIGNGGLSAFGLLHGVTVSSIARRLLPYLDEVGRRQLEAAVVAFVVGAVVGLDRSGVAPTGLAPQAHDPFIVDTVDDLTKKLVASLDDHDIKFAEAASGLYRRTGSPMVVEALRARLDDH